VTGKMGSLCREGAAEAAKDAGCDAACEQLSAEAGDCATKGGIFANGECTITPPPKPHHWWEVVAAVVAVVVVVAIVAVAVVQPELLPAALEAGEVAADIASEGSAAAEGAIDIGADAAADATEATAETAESGADAAETSSTAAESSGENAGDGSSAEAPSSEGSSSSGEESAPKGCNSFVGATMVLLANGSAVPIDQVKVGDVLADAPAGASAGTKDQKHTVSAVIVTTNDTDFTQVTIGTKQGTATIGGTAHHLYWDATTDSWAEADQLHVGDRLQSSDGQSVTVTALHTAAEDSGPYQATYNLTVSGLHTYYVVPGGTPVLVHNCWDDTHPTNCICDNSGGPPVLPGGAANANEMNAAWDEVASESSEEADTQASDAVREAHSTLAAADDGMSPSEVQEIVDNPDDVYTQEDKPGDVRSVYLRQAADGTYDVAVRSFPDDAPITSFRGLTQSSLDGRVASGRWFQ
jgi:hypothetical protein